MKRRRICKQILAFILSVAILASTYQAPLLAAETDENVQMETAETELKENESQEMESSDSEENTEASVPPGTETDNSAPSGTQEPESEITEDEAEENVKDNTEENGDADEEDILGTEDTDVEVEENAPEEGVDNTEEGTAENLSVVGSGTCGENLTWELTSDGVLTISGTGEMANFTSANVPWYYNRKDIVSVVLENGVTSIGEYSFYHCENMDNIELPSGLASIGEEAFAGCSSLSSIDMPDTVTQIGYQAFSGCTGLTVIEIPLGVTKIDINVFNNCDNLSELFIHAGITNIEAGAFRRVPNLTSITVSEDNPSYVSEDGILFSKDKKRLIMYPDGKVGDYYQIPDGVTTISNGAFFSTKLKKIVIPEGVTRIGIYTFGGKLESIELPDSLTEIARDAFWNCRKLKSIVIPDNVSEIGENAFYNCTNLSSIKLPSGITEISDSLFFNCTSLKEIIIPEGVYSIGSNSFSGCTNLESITLSDNISYVGASAFENTGLTSIVFPEKIYSIYSKAFNNCAELKEIYFKGDCPILYNDSFASITVTAYYPSDNSTWTEEKMRDYGGTIMWVEWNPEGEEDGGTTVVGDDTEEEEVELEIGSDVSFEIPEGFPIDCMVGGTVEMEFGDFIPVQFEREGNTFRLGIGTKDLKKFDDSNWMNFKKFVEKQNEEYRDGLDALLDSKFGVASIGMDVKPKISCYGYAEGVITENGIQSLGGRASFGFQVKAEKEWQTVIVVVPVVFKLEGKAGVEINASVGLDLEKATVYFRGDQELTLPELKLSAGVGIAYIADISLYGSLDNKVNLKTSETLPMYYDITATLSGELGASASVLFFSYEKPFFKGDPWTYFSMKAEDNDTGSGSGGGGGSSWDDLNEESTEEISGNGLAMSRYSTSSLLTAAPSEETDGVSSNTGEIEWEILRTEDASEWNGISSDTGSARFSLSDDIAAGNIHTLQSDVYKNAEPVLIATESGVQVLFYTADIEERSTGNHTAVCYSVYDNASGVWKEPVILEDDGTADFEPAIAVDGENVYIAWVNADRVFDEDEASSENFMEILLSCCEIRVARMNIEDESVEFYGITEDSSADLEPAVAVVDGQAAVAWYKNKANDILSGNGENVLYLAVMSEENFEVRTEQTVDRNITATAVGKLDGTCTAAYVLSDSNFAEDTFLSETTQAETSLMLMDATGGTHEITDGGIQSTPMFLVSEDTGQLIWYELREGKASLRYIESLTGESGLWLEDDAVLTPDYTVIEGEGSQLLVCASDNADTNDNGSDLHAYVIADGQVHEPVTLTEVEGYTAEPSGLWDGEDYIFLFTRTDVTFGDSMETTTDLCITAVTPDSSLVVGEAVYNEQNLMPGEKAEITVTVTNNGLESSDISSVQILYEGTVIGEAEIKTALEPGASAEIIVEVTLPESLPENAVFAVRAISGSEVEPDTEALTIGGATADLELTVSEDEENVAVTITNDSAFAAPAVLYVMDGTDAVNATGAVAFTSEAGVSNTSSALESIEFGEIGAYASETKTFSKEEWSALGAETIYLETTTGSSENILSNNSAYAYVGEDVLKDLSHLVVSKKQVKYEKGDVLNLDDMEVTIVYADETEAVVTDYETNMDEIDMSSVGEKTLVITYTEAYQTRKVELTITVSEETGGTDVIKGDINMDHKISLQDLMMSLYHISGRSVLAGDAFTAADINNDSGVTVADLMRMLYYVSGRNTEL